MSDPANSCFTDSQPDSSAIQRSMERALNRQARGWQHGQGESVEDLVADDPLLAADPAAVLELIQQEVAYRRDAGETPELAGYQQRYPELSEALRIQWAVEQFLFPSLPAEAVPDSADALARQRIGRYEVLATLGHGGMGVAYKGWDPFLKRVVVLKLLKSGRHASPLEQARFRIEAEAIARIRHPHVVQVYDFGEASGELVLAMEYCDGGNLAERLRSGPLPPREAAELVRRVAEGIAAAHQFGILHRDLKPANVLLTSERARPGAAESATAAYPKVGDFGLARLLDTDSGDTRSGTLIGTPAYMAPEQVEGRSGGVGPAVDIYAMGVILYESLTGKPPFQGSSPAETLDQVSRLEPIPLRQRRPGIPADLETITLQCLSKMPAQRYSSAQEFAEDLGRFLAGRPISARRIGRFERCGRWCRRNPSMAALLALVFGLLLAVAVIQTVANARLRTAIERAQAATRQGRLREADALVGQAHGIRHSRQEGQRFSSLAAIQQAADIGRELQQPPDWFHALRNEAIAAMALPDMLITRQWNGWPAGTHAATVSADGSTYARGDTQGAVSVRLVAGDREVVRLSGAGVPVDLWLSSDGRDLCGVTRTVDSTHDVAAVWRLGARTDAPHLRVDDVYWMSFADRPQGRLALFAHFDGRLSVFDLATAAIQAHLEPHLLDKKVRFAAHPTLPIVAVYSYFHRELLLRNLDTGDVLWRELPPWQDGNNCAWHPSGDYLCICQADGSQICVYRFDAVDQRLEYERSITCGHGDTRLTFSASGEHFFATGWVPTVSVWDFWTARQIFQTRASSRSRVLATVDSTVGLAGVPDQADQVGTWSVSFAREYRPVVPYIAAAAKDAGDFALHPHGRIAAQHFPDGIRLFDLGTGMELAFLAHEKPQSSTGLHFDRAGMLYTNNMSGMYRWPLAHDPHENVWTMGPPTELPFQPGDRAVAVSRDGDVIAQAMFKGYGMSEYAGGWVWRPEEQRPRRIDSGSSFTTVDVSPDGRWVAFADPLGPIEVFGSLTGEQVWQSQDGGHHPRFSQDGSWLLGGESGCAYAVGSWQAGRSLGPGHVWDCTHDNGMAVLGLGNGTLRLVDMATGRELARLEDPNHRFGDVRFTPDGARVVAAAADGLRVWDLRLIRERLVAMGLDWSAPRYAAAPRGDRAPLRLQILQDGPAP